MSKYVALYGGSFNPSTEAHRDIGLLLLKQLKVDEVWYLVSPQNPFKSKDDMASFEHRLEMAKLNLEEYPQLIVKDLEAKYAATKPDGLIETAETLEYLTAEFPQHRFVWVMGADNFVEFHKWRSTQYMCDHFPIVVITRNGYDTTKAPIADRIPQRDTPDEFRFDNGWYLLNHDDDGQSATMSRDELRANRIPKTNIRPQVLKYALDRKVYEPK